MMPRDGYRPALDGVRAVAVIAVIAYHVSSLLPAGFLGVDIFFVLSGYLITSLLLRDGLEHGRVRLAEFWARRARRLLPALLALLAVTAVVTAYDAPVSTFGERRGDLISTLLYVANWHFIATDQSYFATFAGVSPLRHMWSLAIEEQFYVVWPLVMGAVLAAPAARRDPAKLALWALAAAVVSTVAMALVYDPANPSRSYFGTDTRAHELLVGCALAMLLAGRPGLHAGPAAAALARRAWPPVVALLAVALVTFDDQGGVYYQGGSLAFALAVAALLWVVEADPRSAPAALLSIAPLRWIGVVSYGLYLWHWPIVVWIGDPRAGADPLTTQLAEVALTVVVAAVSFYALERPIRSGRAPWLGFSRRRLVLATLVCFELVWLLAVMGTIVTTSNSAVARGLHDSSDATCPAGSPRLGPGGRFEWCLRIAPVPAGGPVIATAGDSTARALDPGLRVVAADRGWGYVQAAQGGCSFTALLMPSAVSPAAVASGRACVAYVPQVHAQVAERTDPTVWIVADRVLTVVPVVQDDGRVLRAGGLRDALIVRATRDALRRLRSGGAQVVVVGTPPVAEPADCVLKRRAAACDNVSFSRRDPVTTHAEQVVRRVVRQFGAGVVYVDIDDLLCPRVRCPALVGGVLARYDGLHYSATFSRRLVPQIVARAQHQGIEFSRR